MRLILDCMKYIWNDEFSMGNSKNDLASYFKSYLITGRIYTFIPHIFTNVFILNKKLECAEKLLLEMPCILLTNRGRCSYSTMPRWHWKNEIIFYDILINCLGGEAQLWLMLLMKAPLEMSSLINVNWDSCYLHNMMSDMFNFENSLFLQGNMYWSRS